MVAVGRVERDTAQGARALWAHVFGEGKGYLCIFSGRRAAPGSKQLLEVEESFWPYPQSATFAEQEAYQQDALGREVYFCAHLLREKRRRKEAAAPVHCLWVDGDGAVLPDEVPPPTAAVESSPGRQQFYWRLTAPVDGATAEDLNRRLAYAIGADKGGWDLTQLLRVPGCHNRKYPGGPEVEAWPMDDRTAPSEVADLLDVPPAPDRPRPVEPSRPAPGDIGDTEPPVRLDAAGLAWWRGERTATKDDGGIDRSETLWGIARALWAAGASRGTVAAALAERDAALGYGRYTNRPAEYLRIVGKLATDAENGATTGQPHLAVEDAACGNCARLEAELARERGEKREVIALNRAMRKVLANRTLKQEGRAALGLAFEVWDARERKDRDRVVAGESGEPFYEYRPASAGRKVAMSDDAISKSKARLEEWGLLKSTGKTSRQVDPESGEVRYERDSYIHIDAPDIPSWLEEVAAFEPTTDECARAGKRAWGGERYACPEHPGAVVAYDVAATCTECGATIGAHRTFRDAAGAEVPAPAGWSGTRATTGQPQDAGTKVYESTTETVERVPLYPQDAGLSRDDSTPRFTEVALSDVTAMADCRRCGAGFFAVEGSPALCSGCKGALGLLGRRA